MLRIELGKYRMDLPGDVDVDPVARILRAIQEKFK